MDTQTRTFEVDEVTYFTAKDALKDILFMYYDMSTYNGFGHNVECGAFNPYWFLKVKIVQNGFVSENEATAIEQGASIKILNWVNDYLDDNSLNNIEVNSSPWYHLINHGKLSHLPEAESALKAAHTDYDLFQSELKLVYKTYVLGFINANFSG